MNVSNVNGVRFAKNEKKKRERKRDDEKLVMKKKKEKKNKLRKHIDPRKIVI